MADTSGAAWQQWAKDEQPGAESMRCSIIHGAGQKRAADTSTDWVRRHSFVWSVLLAMLVAATPHFDASVQVAL